MTKILKKINIDYLKEAATIWTDYERLNKTHFWSKTAKHWWTNLDQQQGLEFKSSVLSNGYQKLRNHHPQMNSCCICVVNQEMKWLLKCLILVFIASLVFAIVGRLLAKHCKQNND